MSPLVAALIGVLIGALIGAAVTASLLSGRTPTVPTAGPGLSEDIGRILEMLRGAAVVVGPHDELLVANATAERLGLVHGTRIAIPSVLELVRTARRDAEPVTLNLDHARLGGASTLRLALRVLPLSEERVFVLAEDRAQLLRARESSRDFLSNATHELKTPIGAISLLSEAVEDAAADPEAVVRFAGKIRAESARLTDLVTQIITLSRLQGEPAFASADKVLISDVISDAIARCRQLAEARGVNLASGTSADAWVMGDPDQLSTALVNLIQNAISYSDPKARVVVTATAASDGSEEFVDLAVSDNGIGIAPQEQKRIFERFYRVDYARSRQTGGTGLGLSIVQEIAEGHGGSVRVWSKPGAGSTFTLRLPATQPPEEETAERVGPQRATPGQVTPQRVTPQRVSPAQVSPAQATPQREKRERP